MDVRFSNAANAYRNNTKLMDGNPQPQENSAEKPSFSGMIQDALKDVVDTQRTSENMQMQSLTGKVEMSDLITAVANAELTLNTVVAVRDRVISAYQDIIRMPI